MKRTLIPASFGLVLLLMTMTACQASPTIEAKEEIYDFGVVIEGDVVSHAFEIENTGDGTLSITRLSTSCGCTVTTLTDRELEPGDVRRIEVHVNTSGFAGQTISKRVSVFSNDPDHPSIVLTIVGKVVPEAAYLMDVADLSASLMFLVDVRASQAYAAGHLVGSVNLTAVDVDIWIQVLPKDVPVVLYDQNAEIASQIAEQMLREGFINLHVLTGGLDEWIRRFGDRMITTFPLIVGVVKME